jgi:hypothetical protein
MVDGTGNGVASMTTLAVNFMGGNPRSHDSPQAREFNVSWPSRKTVSSFVQLGLWHACGYQAVPSGYARAWMTNQVSEMVVSEVARTGWGQVQAMQSCPLPPGCNASSKAPADAPVLSAASPSPTAGSEESAREVVLTTAAPVGGPQRSESTDPCQQDDGWGTYTGGSAGGPSGGGAGSGLVGGGSSEGYMLVICTYTYYIDPNDGGILSTETSCRTEYLMM